MSERQAGLFSGWWTALLQLRRVAGERREQVLGDIYEGSIPGGAYYVLLGISAVLAGIALMIDSEATLIGASSVAPLMTPIVGMSLGILRGEVELLSRAMLAVFIGALLGVILCFTLGRLSSMDEPTALLFSQTTPTLIDLCVASLAGFAGALAMIDQRVSPILPAVAIAIALNPPIAAIGLYLASETYQGALGALQLFFANVLVILAVGVVVFFVAGFITRGEVGSRRGAGGNFAVTLISLMLVTTALTGHLLTLIDDLRVNQVVGSVPDEQLAQLPDTALTSVEVDSTAQGGSIGAAVETPQASEPKTLEVQSPPPMTLLQQAEPIARAAFADRDHIHIDDISLVELDSGPVLVIAIQSPRQPSAERVEDFQKFLRERLQNNDIRVDIRRISTSEVSAKGPVILGAAHYGTLDELQRRTQAQIESLLTRLIMEKPHFYVQAIDAAPAEKAWVVRGWVAGANVLSPADIKALQGAVKRELNQQVELKIISRVELEVGEEGYQPPPIR